MAPQDSIGADLEKSTTGAMEYSTMTDIKAMDIALKSAASSNAVSVPVPVQSAFQAVHYSVPEHPNTNISNEHPNGPYIPPNGAGPNMASILARINANIQQPEAYDQAKEHVLKSIITSDKLPTLPAPVRERGRGRPRKRPRGYNVATHSASTTTALPSASDLPPTTLEEMGVTDIVPMKRGRGRPRGSTNRTFTSPVRGGSIRRVQKRKGSMDENDSELDDHVPSGSKTRAMRDDEMDNPAELPVQTKSGRQVHKPAPFVPLMASPSSAQGKRGRRRLTFGSGPLGRRNPESALCKVCDRGHSPSNNMVVFCDGCGDAYHQYCHHPSIEKEVVDVMDREWLCKNCVKRREGGLELSGFVSGANMSIDQKRSTLESLSKEKLIEVLMAVHAAHPHFAIFPADGRGSPAIENAPPETHYDGYETDPPSHYPKPGHGLARTLPPETEDLQWLLDDNKEVFNRITYSDGTDLRMADASVNAGFESRLVMGSYSTSIAGGL